MKHVRQWAITSVYVLGAMITGILLLLYIMRCDVVLFPNAMLPMQLYEQASVWLAWGAVPMGIASALLYRQIHIAEDGGTNRKALLAFIPMIICICFLVYWIMAWSVGIFNFYMKGGM